MSRQHDAHCDTHGEAMTDALAHTMIGTASMQSAETLAEEAGFRFKPEVFVSIAFICTRCEWCCGQDECNDDSAGQWICDQCNDEEEEP